MNDRDGNGRKPTKFILKLFRILSDPDNKSVAKWTQCGRSFEIVDIGLFFKKIMPRFFKKKKLNRLIRLLRLYEFSKIKCGCGLVYCHPEFIRGQFERLVRVVKRPARVEDTDEAVSDMKKLIARSRKLMEKAGNLKREIKAVNANNSMVIEQLKQKVVILHAMEAFISLFISNPDSFFNIL